MRLASKSEEKIEEIITGDKKNRIAFGIEQVIRRRVGGREKRGEGQVKAGVVMVGPSQHS